LTEDGSLRWTADTIPVAHLFGELDVANLGIFTAVRDGCPDGHVIVDLTGVTFLDSTGLNELLRLHLLLTMRLVAPTGSVPRRILDVSGLSRLFAVFETVDDALE
jgi:anti-sigma B factor antagonist